MSLRRTRIRLRRSRGPLVEISNEECVGLKVRGRRYTICAFGREPETWWVDVRKLKRYRRRDR